MRRQTRAACSAILMGIAGIIACSESTAPNSEIRSVPYKQSALTYGVPEPTPPGGGNVAFFGDVLRSGGKTTAYTSFNRTGVPGLLWGPNSNASIQLALDGAVDDPSETLTFASTPDDIAAGALIWTGQSTITYTVLAVTHIDMVSTRLTATATNDVVQAAVIAGSDLQSVGISSSIGAAFDVDAAVSTFQTNAVFEVYHNNVWTPALDLFDQLGISAGQIVSQFTPAFYATYSGAHLFSTVTAHDFGNVFIGNSVDFDLVLQNNGAAAATVSAADFSGANPGDFAVASNGCVDVAVDATCALTVHFAPTAVGARGAGLLLSGDFPSVTIPISGTGDQGMAAIETSPAGLGFGARDIGTVTTLPLGITNTGTAAFVHSGFTIGGADPSDFLIIGNDCPASLAVSASCVVNVQYSPTVIGSRSAALTITGNAPTVTVPLTGGGVALEAVASPNPTNLAFTAFNVGATSTPRTFVVTNTGNAPLMISVINMLGANPVDFNASGCVGQTLAPALVGSFCVVSVTFSPKAAGSRSAQLSIVSNAGPASVALTGIGIATSPLMLIDPASLSLSFNQVVVGGGSATLPITIGNQGNGDLVINSASIAPGVAALDYALSGSCGTFSSIIAPGTHCLLLVTFDPVAIGTRNATLLLSTNSGSPSFNLTGVGVGTPAIETSSADIEFGVKDLASVTTLPLTITNRGTAAFVHSFFIIGGVNASDFQIFSHNCPTSLPINASCVLNVQYTPTGIGSRSATLSITGNAPTVSVLLGGVALAPVATPSPTSLAFTPNINVGSTSARSFVITNTGNASLVIGVFNMLGANPLDFNASGCIGTTLGPSASCSVNVTFSPKDDGPRSAQLSIVSNGEPASVTLTGTGNPVFPQLVIDPTNLSLNFNQVAVGGGGATLPITIGNTGIGDLVLNSALIAAGPYFLDYSLSGSCSPFPAVLVTGGTCELRVTFDPNAAGVRNTNLVLSTNNGSRTFTLAGVGVIPAPQIQLSPNFLNFGTVLGGGDGATLPVTISNHGTANLVLNSASITGTAAAEFAVSGSCTPFSAVVAPGASCELRVTFDPTAAGTRTANIAVSSNAGPPQGITLTGVGVIPAPRILLNTSGVSFPTIPIGGTSFASTPPNITVTNTGNANLVISSINLTGMNASEFAVRNQNCTFGPIAPNATCVFDLAFSPTATGSRSAQLFLSANATSGPVQLVGTGTGQPEIFVSPTNLAYGARPVGTTSPSQAVTITSTGNLPLHITETRLGSDHPGEFTITGTTCPTAVAPGTSCTISLSFTPSAGGTSLGTMIIFSDANPGGVQVNLAGSGILPADLAASMSANPISGKAGKPLTYSIGIRNYGPGSATDLVITDALPASTTFASIAAPAGLSCTTPAAGSVGTVVCQTNSLLSGGSISISLTVNLLSGGKASISNTVNVSSSSSDAATANNSATVATTISGRK
jgi:uncharacterized repeat protein (TIGR01451 family)